MSGPTRGDGWRALWRPALIVAAALAAYQDSFGGAFLFDDSGSILRNPEVSAPAEHLRGLLLRNRQLSIASFALNHAAGGFDPPGYHAVNLGVHVAAALLLYGLVRRTLELQPQRPRYAGRAADIAAAAALIWAVHPLQTQAVTYIVQRMESLMAMFYLATLYSLLRGATAGDRPRTVGWYTAAAACAALSMASKEVAVTVPLVALLYDRCLLAGSFRRALAARWLGFLGLAFFLVLAPTSSLLPVADLAVEHRMYLPLAAVVTLAVLAGDALLRSPRVSAGVPAWVGACVVGVVAVTFGGMTWNRNTVYKDRETLWADVVRKRPLNVRGHNNLGNLLSDMGDPTAGLPYLRRAVEITPSYTDALAGLGAALAKLGRFDEAIPYLESGARHATADNGAAAANLAMTYRKVGRFDDALPWHAAALAAAPDNHNYENQTGLTLLLKGSPAEAADHFRSACRLAPTSPRYHGNLAFALEQAGQAAAAEAEYRETLRVAPG